MARLSALIWKTSEGAAQITTLPCVTEVAFNVTPRTNSNGFEVHYRLHSARVQFVAGDLMPVGEAQGSGPPPAPNRRDDRIIEDRYAGLTSPTDVKRRLTLVLTSALKPAMASLDVSVFDVTEKGELKNVAEDTVAISFNL